MSSDDEDWDDCFRTEEDEAFAVLSARRTEERRVATTAAEARIMTPRAAPPPPAPEHTPPSEHDALSYLLGHCGWRAMASHAAVCRPWRDAARAKLQEWAVLQHDRVTGGAIGLGPGCLQRPSAILDTGAHGLVVVDQGKLQILSAPASSASCSSPPAATPSRTAAPGTWRIIDSLIPPGAADALRERPYVDELLERHGGAVPLSSCAIGALATDDGGVSLLLGVSVQGQVVRSLGFGGRVERGPRSGQLLRIRLSDGALLHASATPHTPAAHLGQPSGLATCAGRVFVSDAQHHCVRILDAKSLGPPAGLTDAEALIGGVGASHAPPRADDALRCPQGLAFSLTHEELYVCDKDNHRLCVFTPSGERLRCIGKQGQLPGQFNEPVDVALGRWRVYVAEGRRVQVLSLQGQPLQVLQLPGLRLRGLSLSASVAAFGAAQRLSVSVAQSGVHLVNVGTAALAPP